MKAYLLIALAGCNSGALPTPVHRSFPIGKYTNCAEGAHNPSGNTFLNEAGFESGANLTLIQSGDTVTSTYVDQNGVIQSLRFSATSATLAEAGQVIPGFAALCVMGPGNEASYPSSMTVNAGALSYDGGALFVTLTGSLQSDAGRCGTLSQPDASFWVLCRDRQGGALPSVEPSSAQLPVGQYKCNSQVETFVHLDGLDQIVAGGGSGTLLVTNSGVTYSGDSSLAGTLRLVATSSTTADVAAGQSLSTPCMVPLGAPQTPEPLPITAASLSLVDSTLFLSFSGTMADSSSCPDTQVAGSLICTR